MLWRSLHHFNIHLYMAIPTIPLPWERDQVIMEIFQAESLSPEIISGLGRCRGVLKAIFLSDITTADGWYLENFVFDPGGTKTKSNFKFPCKILTNNNWNSWFNFWHNFTSTGDKLKVPLGNWTHPTHRIWQWYYKAQEDNLQRIDGGTIYHYKLVLGYQHTQTMRMYHLVREKPFSPAVALGLPTSTLGFSNQQVVKLSKGPALAQASGEIKNFWEFLHSWGGNWMWRE